MKRIYLNEGDFLLSPCGMIIKHIDYIDLDAKLVSVESVSQKHEIMMIEFLNKRDIEIMIINGWIILGI